MVLNPVVGNLGQAMGIPLVSALVALVVAHLPGSPTSSGASWLSECRDPLKMIVAYCSIWGESFLGSPIPGNSTRGLGFQDE